MSWKQDERGAGQFPLERWVSGWSGTDWYVKASRISILLAVHKVNQKFRAAGVTESGSCLKQCPMEASLLMRISEEFGPLSV